MVVGIHIAPFGIQETNSDLYYANFYLQNCVFRIAVPFFFVTIGMTLFKNKDRILQKKVWICLLCSCVLWFAEVSLLKHFNFAKNYDCTFFVVPVVILLFITVFNINISNEILCRKLGILSRLIFYTHLLVAFIIDIIFKHIPSHLLSTPLRFGTVVVITILISIFMLRLSDKKKLEWIKKLY